MITITITEEELELIKEALLDKDFEETTAASGLHKKFDGYAKLYDKLNKVASA